ncbi:MAG: hypothetical protein KGZ25_16325 [Planctomycetes bacterium]|nr:hypothetical protein [Planctomycetota bacterium]
MTRFRLCCYLAIALAVFAGCATYKQGRPEVYEKPDIKRVAILPFENPEFTDQITEILVHKSKWGIMDRASMEQILREQDPLHSDGKFDRETAVHIGKIAEVDAVLFGDYSASRTVIKMVNVKTGEFLVYKNVDLTDCADMRLKAAYCLQHLLPHAIKMQAGKPVKVFHGDNVDQKDPLELE